MTDSALFSTSVSFVRTLPTMLESSAPVFVSTVPTGASLTAVTPKESVAREVRFASCIV